MHFRKRALYYTTYPINEQARDARDRFVKDKAEGFEKAKLDDALKFKELGVALEVISLATGLSAEEIEGL